MICVLCSSDLREDDCHDRVELFCPNCKKIVCIVSKGDLDIMAEHMAKAIDDLLIKEGATKWVHGK